MDWATVLMNWAPFLILIVVWVVLSRQMRGRSSLGQIGTQYDVQLAEMKRTNALLDRIATALEKRVGA